MSFSSTISITYKQGAISQGDVLGTWQEVLNVCDAYNQDVDIYIDSSLTTYCDADISHNFKGKTNFYSVITSGITASNFRILDGVTLTNICSISGSLFIVANNPSGVPSLEFTGDTDVFFMNTWSGMSNQSFGGGPMISFADNGVFQIQMSDLAFCFSNPSFPLIRVGTNTILSFTLLNSSSYPDNGLSSIDNTAQVFVYSDSSSTFQTNQPLFSASLSLISLDQSSNIYYSDTSSQPELFSTNVQGAIDSLKQVSSLSVLNDNDLFLPAATVQPVTFTLMNFSDPTGGINYSPGDSKIAINTSGEYLITWCLWFKDTKFTRRAYIALNGNMNLGDMLYAQAENYTDSNVPIRLSSSALIQLQAGDYFELVAYCDNDTLISSSSKSEYARLQIIRQNRVFIP